jgi:uncharacterized protein (TIGR04222 family)
MSLFDLPGPAFLLAYAVIVAMVTSIASILVTRLEAQQEPPLLHDAYGIAYLRGGAREALRVATLSLIDRGLLVVDGDKVSWRTPRQAPAVVHPIEREVIRATENLVALTEVLSARHSDAAQALLEKQLRDTGVLDDSSRKPLRAFVFVVATGVLWAVAGYKLVLAAERGHRNVLLLWLIAIVATGVAAVAVFRPRPTRGERALGVSRELFAGLRRRAGSLRAGRDPVEVLQLAAVFGVENVPSAIFPHAALLGPPPRARKREEGSSSSSDGCGTSCGSGSSGGGSSCGGGGGGGCGGCGS